MPHKAHINAVLPHECNDVGRVVKALGVLRTDVNIGVGLSGLMPALREAERMLTSTTALVNAGSKSRDMSRLVMLLTPWL